MQIVKTHRLMSTFWGCRVDNSTTVPRAFLACCLLVVLVTLLLRQPQQNIYIVARPQSRERERGEWGLTADIG